MSKFEATLDFGAAGEKDVIVYFDHQPFEAEERDYPGCPEAYIIGSVTTEFNEVTTETLQELSKYDINQLEIEAGEQ
jgi:hypothetical protein